MKAIVGRPNVTVYFKNFDVDDPSNDEEIDDNGIEGFDNREGRIILFGQPNPYPPAAAGTLSSASAVTNANGEAIVYFSVTKQPGDNFIIAASTNESNLNGVTINGTGLKDSANNPLPTNNIKKTELLTTWRKVHLEVDSMGPVNTNFITGRTRNSSDINVGQQPVWINVLSNGKMEVGRFRATYRADGSILSYGGRMSLGNDNLQVLDNIAGSVLVRNESGTVSVSPNYIFALFDDDDFNSNDISLWRGDDGENVEQLFDTLSHLQESDDVNKNPYAAAYIRPDYTWAAQQLGMNDSDVTFEPHHPFTIRTTEEREIMEPYRDSKNTGTVIFERDDFWVGYLLIAYQSAANLENDPTYYPPLDQTLRNVVTGVAPVMDIDSDLSDGTIDSRLVPRGSLGAIIYIESMRDLDAGPFLYPNTLPSTNSRITAAPHELGHQFGLRGDSDNAVFGVMCNLGITYSLQFNLGHINLMRWRIKSPGEGGQ